MCVARLHWCELGAKRKCEGNGSDAPLRFFPSHCLFSLQGARAPPHGGGGGACVARAHSGRHGHRQDHRGCVRLTCATTHTLACAPPVSTSPPTPARVWRWGEMRVNGLARGSSLVLADCAGAQSLFNLIPILPGLSLSFASPCLCFPLSPSVPLCLPPSPSLPSSPAYNNAVSVGLEPAVLTQAKQVLDRLCAQREAARALQLAMDSQDQGECESVCVEVGKCL